MNMVLKYLAHRRYNIVDSSGIAAGSIAFGRGDWFAWICLLAFFMAASVIIERLAQGRAS